MQIQNVEEVNEKEQGQPLSILFLPIFYSVDFDAGIVLLSSDHEHGLVGEVFFVVVDQPGRTFRNEIKAEGKGKEEEARGQREPVPLEAAAHYVATENT